ncbi:inorganic polyphosphate/ATP-NAD kinase [unidentified eubacterium SCB49]|nr:inorganic polyphosphate/ATP-NAD kinase [unidentified eubacterium SCB49]
MKYFLASICIILSVINSQSQTYEVGAMVGGANFIGDVGRSSYIYPNSLAIGGIAKWNRSDRHSFRFSVLTTKISGDDADSSEKGRQERGYTFKNNLTELSLGLEYTFWEFNMYGGRRANAPYLYTGLTYLLYDSLKLNPTEGVLEKYNGTGDFAIPMVVGFKTSVSTNMIAAFEIGARYVMSDSVDGSVSPDDDYAYYHFGDTNNNDWYVFTGITFTFTFGRQPCYCNF